MKSWKRNALVAAILFFVCGGIYLNWRYETRAAVDLVSTLDAEKILDDATLVLAQGEDPAAQAAAADPSVRLQLSAAVAALLNLGADQITVVKMK